MGNANSCPPIPEEQDKNTINDEELVKQLKSTL
jgi:hypothetical protein